jgi:hypothetical protein
LLAKNGEFPKRRTRQFLPDVLRHPVKHRKEIVVNVASDERIQFAEMLRSRTAPTLPKACEIADIARTTFYEWIKDDPEFKAAYEAAREEAVQVLEDEAIRRATIGGSDTLLIFLLKAARPQKYRDYVRQEVTGPNGAGLVPTRVEIVSVPAPDSGTS